MSQRVLALGVGLWFASVTTGLAPVRLANMRDPALMQSMGMAAMDPSTPSSHCPRTVDHSRAPVPPGDVPSAPGSHHCPGCPAACCATGVVTLPPGRLVAPPVIPAVIVATLSRATTDAPKPVAIRLALYPPVGPPSLIV